MLGQLSNFLNENKEMLVKNNELKVYYIPYKIHYQPNKHKVIKIIQLFLFDSLTFSSWNKQQQLHYVNGNWRFSQFVAPRCD